MGLREPGQGLIFRGWGRWGQAGGLLGEHKSAADDYPAVGQGQGRTGLGRKEAECLGDLKCSSPAVEGRVPRNQGQNGTHPLGIIQQDVFGLYHSPH